MRAYLQWTLATPQPWVTLDITRIQDWRNLPNKPVPTAQSVVNDTPGWLWDLEVGGVHALGSIDHCAISLITGGLRVTRWEDDPDDFTPDKFRAEVWEFLVPTFDAGKVRVPETQTVRGSTTLARLAKLGLRDAGFDRAAFLTRLSIESTFPSSEEVRGLLWEAALEIEPRSRLVIEYRADGLFRESQSQHLAFSQFVSPAANVTRHGINVDDATAARHGSARGPIHEWMHWIEP